MTTIRYFIPEDGDVEMQPNVFLAPKPRQPGYPPTLGEVKQAFPLPGRYHFRFKTPLSGDRGDKGSNALAVWMDCTDDRQPVPVWQSQIVAKITRIGVEDDDDDDDDEDFRRPEPTSSSAAQPSSQQQQQPQMQHTPVAAATAAPPAAASFDLFDAPSAHAPAPASHGYSMDSHTSGSLFDSHVSAAPVSGNHGSGSGGSLLDLNYQQPVNNNTNMHSDFLGMSTSTPTPTTAPSPPVSGNYGGYGMAQQQQQVPNQQQQQQRPPQQQLRTNGSFDSFGKGSGGAFGDLGTPWK